MSLLSIVNKAQALLNLPVTSTVIGNSGGNQKQLLALANTDGELTADEFSWQNLITEKTFVTTATEEQTNLTLPADFGWIVDETFFNRTTTLEIKGPLNAREWQELKARGISVSEPRFRLRGNAMLFAPAPTAGQNCYFEYVSKNWCESAGGTDQSAWTLDTDVPRIPEHVLVLGLVWRWRAAKGFDFTQNYQTWEEAVNRATARDGAKRKLSLVGPSSPYSRRRNGNVPEGNW